MNDTPCTKPRRRRVAIKTKIEHDDDLRAYLRGGASCTMAQSNFGAMLERLAVMGVTEIECPRCRRRRRRRARRRRAQNTSAGSTVIRQALGYDRTAKVAALFAAAGWSLPRAQTLMDEIEDGGCRLCGGTGRIRVRITPSMEQNEAINRRPTGSSKHGRPPDTTGDGAELERMGRVGVVLARMRERDPEAAEAICTWQSPDGGDLVCLLGLTEPGRLLARRRQPGQHLHAFFVAEQRRRLAGYTDHQRDRLFERAEAEAQLLLDTAVMLWDELWADQRLWHEHERRVRVRAEARQELREIEEEQAK